MKSLFRYRSNEKNAGRYRRGNQEQTQIIATAMGKPMANAPTIAMLNAESKFTSGRTLYTDMLLAPPIGKSKSRHQDEAVTDFLALAHTVPRSPG
jgi:hypothetical protein